VPDPFSVRERDEKMVKKTRLFCLLLLSFFIPYLTVASLAERFPTDTSSYLSELSYNVSKNPTYGSNFLPAGAESTLSKTKSPTDRLSTAGEIKVAHPGTYGNEWIGDSLRPRRKGTAVGKSSTEWEVGSPLPAASDRSPSTRTFPPLPEPFTLLLLGAGLVVLAELGIRFTKR
jgi:hypothetical protein